MAAEVAKRTQGTLTIAINPAARRYPGQASLDAVQTKLVPYLRQQRLPAVDRSGPRFLNLPFTITDQLMTKPGGGRRRARAGERHRRAHGLKRSLSCRADTIMISRTAA